MLYKLFFKNKNYKYNNNNNKNRNGVLNIKKFEIFLTSSIHISLSFT